MLVTLLSFLMAAAPVDACQPKLTCDQKLVACQAELSKVNAVCKRKKRKKTTATVLLMKEQAKPCCAAPVTVVNNVNVGAVASVEEVSLWKRERPKWLLGLRGSGGMAFCAPAGIGLIGLRFNYLPVRLGVDVYTEFYHGTGAQLLVYPVQGKVAMWHINGGALWFNERPFLLPSLPRQVDLTLGSGLEVRVLPFLWVTADVQVRMPNPIAIAESGQQFGDVFVNSLVQTQGLLGLMLRTW